MTETQLWGALKSALPTFHWQRIETITGSGVPDVNGCHNGVEVWLELKIIRGIGKPYFQSSQGLTPVQCAWLENRWRAGGRAFVLGYWKDKERLCVWRGNQARELVGSGPNLCIPSAVFERPWDKERLRITLTTRA